MEMILYFMNQFSHDLGVLILVRGLRRRWVDVRVHFFNFGRYFAAATG
jgi:hypothetical protein